MTEANEMLHEEPIPNEPPPLTYVPDLKLNTAVEHIEHKSRNPWITGSILAIDQATLSGYAVVDRYGRVKESGTWLLAERRRSGESRGFRYVRLMRQLEYTLTQHPDIKVIIHEQTLMRGGDSTEMANGYKATILTFAELHGIMVSCVHATELKRWATGSGKATKEEMIQACIEHGGVSPKDDNEADAVLIGLWAAATYFKGTFKGCESPIRKAIRKKVPQWIRDLIR